MVAINRLLTPFQFVTVKWIAVIILFLIGNSFLGCREIHTEKMSKLDPCNHHLCPDMNCLPSEYLKDLYCASVRAMPRFMPRLLWESSMPGDNLDWDEKDVALILDTADEALTMIPPDWTVFRCCLYLARTGMQHDPRWLPIYEQALYLPRGEKISNDHGRALKDVLALIAHLDTEEAATILEMATTDVFWGETPFRSLVLSTNPDASRAKLRYFALTSMPLLSPEHALPILERLSKQYPNKGPGHSLEQDFRFEDFAGYVIEKQICEIKEKE